MGSNPHSILRHFHDHFHDHFCKTRGCKPHKYVVTNVVMSKISISERVSVYAVFKDFFDRVDSGTRTHIPTAKHTDFTVFTKSCDHFMTTIKDVPYDTSPLIKTLYTSSATSSLQATCRSLSCGDNHIPPSYRQAALRLFPGIYG